MAARRVGTFKTTLGSQALSLPLLAAALALTGNFPALTPLVLGAAILQGTLGAVALASLYRGLAIGPIAIVSPIVAAYAAITVVLAVVLLGEALSPLQAAAMTATLLGVILASTDLRVVRETLALARNPSGLLAIKNHGVVLALVSMVAFGVLSFLLAFFTRTIGLFATVLWGRAALTASLVLAGAARREMLGGLRAPMLALLVFVGVLDLAAMLSFGLGSLAGYASIVAIGASAYPLIPMVFGLGLLRERVAPNQLVGVVLLIGGLVTLGASG